MTALPNVSAATTATPMPNVSHIPDAPPSTTSTTPLKRQDNWEVRDRAWSLHCQGLRSPQIAEVLAAPERTVRHWIAATRDELAAELHELHSTQLLTAVDSLRHLLAAAWEMFELEREEDHRLLLDPPQMTRAEPPPRPHAQASPPATSPSPSKSRRSRSASSASLSLRPAPVPITPSPPILPSPPPPKELQFPATARRAFRAASVPPRTSRQKRQCQTHHPYRQCDQMTWNS